MMDKFENRKKKIDYLLSGIVIMLDICFVILLLRVSIFKDPNAKLDYTAVIDRINGFAKSEVNIKTKVDDSYYEIEDEENIFMILQNAAWKEDKQAPQSNRCITFRLSEFYEVYIYDNGTIEVFDGYAKIMQKSTKLYCTNQNLYHQLKSYITEYGIEFTHYGYLFVN